MIISKLKDKLPKKSADEEDLIVGIDIGTEFVKALVARIKDEDIEIIGVGRARQSLDDMHGGAISDIAGVVRNCEEALAAAEEQAGVQGKRAVMGIAGELVKGVTQTI